MRMLTYHRSFHSRGRFSPACRSLIWDGGGVSSVQLLFPSLRFWSLHLSPSCLYFPSGTHHTSTVEPTYTDSNRSLYKDILLFWTGFGISLLEYLLFSSIYWWALYRDRQKWTSGLLAIPILCSAVVLAASVSLSMWKLQSIGRILLAVRKES